MVVVDDVVLAPQPLVGGHAHEQGATRADDAPQLAQRVDVVLDVLDHVEAHGQVEALVRERHVGDRRLDDLAHAARACPLDARLGDLDAGHGAEAREVDHVATGAAAGVQHLGRRRQREPVDDPADDAAAPAVPPVALLDLEDLLFEIPVHTRTYPRAPGPHSTRRPPSRRRIGTAGPSRPRAPGRRDAAAVSRRRPRCRGARRSHAGRLTDVNLQARGAVAVKRALLVPRLAVVRARRPDDDAARVAADEDPVAGAVRHPRIAYEVVGVVVLEIAVAREIADVQAVARRRADRVHGVRPGSPREEVRVLLAVAAVAEDAPVRPAAAVVSHRHAAEAAREAAAPDRAAAVGDVLGGVERRRRAGGEDVALRRRPVALVLRPRAGSAQAAAEDQPADLSLAEVDLRDRQPGPGADVADRELARGLGHVARRGDRAPGGLVADRDADPGAGVRRAGEHHRAGARHRRQRREDDPSSVHHDTARAGPQAAAGAPRAIYPLAPPEGAVARDASQPRTGSERSYTRPASRAGSPVWAVTSRACAYTHSIALEHAACEGFGGKPHFDSVTT